MSAITIKGEREGLVLILGQDAPDEPEALGDALRHALEARADFFRGATVTLDVGARELPADALTALVHVAGQFGLRVTALRAQSEATRAAARALGLELSSVAERVTSITPTVPDEAQPALVIRRTVRSGQSVRYPGTVVVFGDVNPGGEIIAAGDIFVWGRLRGVVHAGASGDDGAVVCALELAPTQLRIGNHIARPPEESPRWRLRLWRPASRPEIARVLDGAIVVEKWR